MRSIFDHQLATPEAQAELALAGAIATEAAACLLCFERDPQTCHRLAVAEALHRPIRHLFCESL